MCKIAELLLRADLPRPFGFCTPFVRSERTDPVFPGSQPAPLRQESMP
jgi:hypothetical protein